MGWTSVTMWSTGAQILRNQKLYRLPVTLIIFGLLSITFYIVDLELGIVQGIMYNVSCMPL